MVTLKIISEGTRASTRVVAVDEDGFEHEVRYVGKVEWGLDARTGVAHATLHAIDVPVDLEIPAGSVDVRSLNAEPIPVEQ